MVEQEQEPSMGSRGRGIKATRQSDRLAAEISLKG